MPYTTLFRSDTINELEPTRFSISEEVAEIQEEIIEAEEANLDPDKDKSDGDILDEITGQMKLF